MTIVIQIGNTDNKLSQQLWSEFIKDLKSACNDYVKQVFFSGGSNCENPWQNYAYIFESNSAYIDDLRTELTILRRKYAQESLSFQIGETELL